MEDMSFRKGMFGGSVGCGVGESGVVTTTVLLGVLGSVDVVGTAVVVTSGRDVSRLTPLVLSMLPAME